MTLREACNKVIAQNESLGYHPEIFIFQTKRGEVVDLEYRVKNFIKSKKAIDFVQNAIKKYGKILTIEDLIVKDVEGLGFSEEIRNKAKENTIGFNWLRKKYNSLR